MPKADTPRATLRRGEAISVSRLLDQRLTAHPGSLVVYRDGFSDVEVAAVATKSFKRPITPKMIATVRRESHGRLPSEGRVPGELLEDVLRQQSEMLKRLVALEKTVQQHDRDFYEPASPGVAHSKPQVNGSH